MAASYGRAGAIYEAFNCVDEMILNGIKPKIDIFNNLLCGCISQPVYGFKYALAVWQMCLKLKIKPDINTYNLLLKAAKDCNTSHSLVKIPNSKKESIFLENKNKFFPKEKNLFPENTEEHVLFLENDFSNGENAENVSLNKSRFDASLIKKLSTNIDKVMADPENKIHQSESSKVLHLESKDVHVIQDLEVIGKSLESQIRDLEWWQEIKTNINTVELMEDVSKYDLKINFIIKKHFLFT